MQDPNGDTGVPPGPPWRVLVADDDGSFRRLVRRLMAEDPAFEVVGEAADGVEAVELAARLQPHCVILDMKMPVMDGRAALRLIRRRCPQTDVIGLSGLDWSASGRDAPDAMLEKERDTWMQMLPVLVETLATNRQASLSSGGLSRTGPGGGE